MRTHQDIDRRSLALAQAVVAKIDDDPNREGLLRARNTCARWFNAHHAPAIAEWLAILQGNWEGIRLVLLDTSQNGQRLRQSNPFCDVLTTYERWEIFQRFIDERTGNGAS